MKKIFRLTALSMCLLSTAVAFGSCKKQETIVTPVVDPETVYNGTHIYTATDTNEYLVKNGKTDYELVVPAEQSSSILIARTEFVDLFRIATGITINVVTDEEATNAASGKYISLGKTELLKNSGVQVDYRELSSDGHKIVTVGDDIYICGGKDEGTIFGVYTFMNLTFDYETYFFDCMDIENTSEKKLKNYDVTDIPDFKTRAHSADVTTYESTDYEENMYAWRLRYYGKEANRGYYYMPVHENIEDFSVGKKSASTNVRRWFPEYMYKDASIPDSYHPKWFSDNGGEQVCFSAHGDPEEYEAMVDLAFRKVEAHLKHYTPDKYPRYKIMTLTHMDNTNYCTCDKCKEISSYYADSQAAVQVLFMNDLAKRVDALLEANKDAEWYREDFKLLFFAYNHNIDPPAKYDAAQKKYVPVDEKVILHDRVIAWFCREADGQQTFDEGENVLNLSQLQGWAACANNINYWNYGTNFKNYMMPYDIFQYSTPTMYAYFCNASDSFWFTQFQDHSQCRNTAWQSLKVYLDSKLAWDTSLDTEELTEKWFKAMFKDAAPTMMRLFQAERAYLRHVIIDKLGVSAKSEMALAEYWPIGLLEGWLSEIDKAKAEVERFKEIDADMYEKICKRIETEAISYLYILIETQRYTLAADVKKQYIDRITYDVDWLDISGMAIQGSKSNLVGWLEGL